eukprot:7207327-Pyramimonas_sp.AAC.1
MLGLLALICSRAHPTRISQSLDTALFVFDSTPLEVYLSYLQRAFRAAPKAGEERTAGRKGQGGRKRMEHDRE